MSLTKSYWRTPGWRGEIAALFAGAIIPYSFAPYNIWLLGILGACTLAILLKGLNGKQAFIRSWIFGVGLYTSGASWVYVSIHDFGAAATPLAILLTGIFVVGLGFVFAVPFYYFKRYFSKRRLGFILGFAAAWTLGEWSRSWFLTGFPWLYLGYAHIDTWLAGWAPIGGVYTIGFICVVTGTACAQCIFDIAHCLKTRKSVTLDCLKVSVVNISIICFLWFTGLLLSNVSWTTQENKASVSLIQPNIPLELKWNPSYRGHIMDTLIRLSEPNWDSDIVVWPEASIPLMYHDALDFLELAENKAKETQTTLITGILYDNYDPFAYYNSIIALGDGSGKYFKQRLVPFGEYVPLEHWLRGLIAFFDLPNSVIHKGPKNQNGLNGNGYKIAPSICYEVVYPDFVAKNSSNAQVLVTISNDAWFGDSIGPLQHFEMAQMRALENERYMIRSTNTGLSGIINEKGKISLAGTQFQEESLKGEVKLLTGSTPFSKYRSTPILILCLIIILACLIRPKLRRFKQIL